MSSAGSQLRVVLDTAVVVSAFRSRLGASFQVLQAVREHRLVAIATTTLFFEYEGVLERPEQRAVMGLSLTDLDIALGALAKLIEPIDVRFRLRPRLLDPNDEMVLEAAVSGRADALVTFNTADFVVATPRFGLTLLRPHELLERVNR